MRSFCSLTTRVALAAWVACVGCVTLATAPGTIAAASSTWYWQNPLPRAYPMDAIACSTVQTCAAVGAGGSITTTSDGGGHWTDRVSGTTLDLIAVSCPGGTVCYAATAGSIVKSVDGGVTWARASGQPSLPANQVLNRLTCASQTICFVTSAIVDGSSTFVDRTADGGQTWQTLSEFVRNEGGPVCATSLVCYAWTGRTVFRSEDAGATWKQWSQVSGGNAGYVTAMACPQAATCLAGLYRCPNCGHAQAVPHEDIFLTRDDGTTWHRVDRVDPVNALVCGSATTCYLVGSSLGRTTDGGAAWSSHRFPFPGFVPQVVCPGSVICYAAARYTALTTIDGFLHVHQTPARSSIPGLSLESISCPSTTTCYVSSTYPADGRTVWTRDGGKYWSTLPNTSPGDVTCPTTTVCYRFSSPNGPPTQGDHAFRSTDGARSWHKLARPLPQLSGSICFGALTCDVLVGGAQGYRLLITTNGGKTWSAKRRIGWAIRSTTLDGPMSCANSATCFVLTSRSVRRGTALTFRVYETKDAGESWHAWAPVGCTERCGDNTLDCPAVTTCYIVPVRATVASPYPIIVVVTHNAGTTWHKATVAPATPNFLRAVACAGAQSCRVAGPAGIYATQDGGRTWQRQTVEGGDRSFPDLQSVACPAIATCYAVGDEAILATHPSR